jgi:hypothetical protein
MPDIGHDSPVLPVMAETPKRDGLTREALPHTLAVTTRKAATPSRMVVVRPNYPTIGRRGVFAASVGFFHFY